MSSYLNRICRNVLRTNTAVPATAASFGDNKIVRNLGNNDIVKLNTSPSNPADSFKITAYATCGFTLWLPYGVPAYVTFVGSGASPGNLEIDYVPLWTGVEPWRQMEHTAGAGFVGAVNGSSGGPVLKLNGSSGGARTITSYGCSALLNRRSAGHWQISLIAFLGLDSTFLASAGTTYLQDNANENPRGTYSNDGSSENIAHLGGEDIRSWGAGKFTIADN